MKTIKVIFNDDDYCITRINGTNEEILKYYIGNVFSYFDGEKECKHICIGVLFLDLEIKQ